MQHVQSSEDYVYTAWLHRILLTTCMESLDQQCIAHSGSPHDDESIYNSHLTGYIIALPRIVVSSADTFFHHSDSLSEDSKF